MRRTWLGAVLCLAVMACLMGGLLHLAGTPKEHAPEEGTVQEVRETREPIPLDLTTSKDAQGRPVFSFTLENLIESYNSLCQEDLLPSAHLWTKSANLSQREEPIGDCYSASPDPEVWFLPTVSVYTHSGEQALSKLSVDLDEHSDSPEKHDLFQTMSLYALALFFPDLEEDAREALYLELDRQAYENLYTGIYHDEIIPHILYYQGDIGVFPFFALGEYERFTFLPVPQEKLDGLAAQGTRLVDLDQWSP